MSRSGAKEQLRRALDTAAAPCPSLQQRTASSHVLRHAKAMHLL